MNITLKDTFNKDINDNINLNVINPKLWGIDNDINIKEINNSGNININIPSTDINIKKPKINIPNLDIDNPNDNNKLRKPKINIDTKKPELELNIEGPKLTLSKNNNNNITLKEICNEDINNEIILNVINPKLWDINEKKISLSGSINGKRSFRPKLINIDMNDPDVNLPHYSINGSINNEVNLKRSKLSIRNINPNITLKQICNEDINDEINLKVINPKLWAIDNINKDGINNDINININIPEMNLDIPNININKEISDININIKKPELKGDLDINLNIPKNENMNITLKDTFNKDINDDINLNVINPKLWGIDNDNDIREINNENNKFIFPSGNINIPDYSLKGKIGTNIKTDINDSIPSIKISEPNINTNIKIPDINMNIIKTNKEPSNEPIFLKELFNKDISENIYLKVINPNLWGIDDIDIDSNDSNKFRNKNKSPIDINIKGPKIDVNLPDMNISGKISGFDENIKKPKVDSEVNMNNILGSDFQDDSQVIIYTEYNPELTLKEEFGKDIDDEIYNINIYKHEFNLDNKSFINVSSLKNSQNNEIKGNSININIPNIDIKKGNIEMPKVNIEGPDIKIDKEIPNIDSDNFDININELDLDTPITLKELFSKDIKDDIDEIKIPKQELWGTFKEKDMSNNNKNNNNDFNISDIDLLSDLENNPELNDNLNGKIPEIKNNINKPIINANLNNNKNVKIGSDKDDINLNIEKKIITPETLHTKFNAKKNLLISSSINENANIVMTPNLFSKENNININKPELKVGLNIPDIKLSQDNEFNPNKTLKEIFNEDLDDNYNLNILKHDLTSFDYNHVENEDIPNNKNKGLPKNSYIDIGISNIPNHQINIKEANNENNSEISFPSGVVSIKNKISEDDIKHNIPNNFDSKIKFPGKTSFLKNLSINSVISKNWNRNITLRDLFSKDINEEVDINLLRIDPCQLNSLNLDNFKEGFDLEPQNYDERIEGDIIPINIDIKYKQHERNIDSTNKNINIQNSNMNYNRRITLRELVNMNVDEPFYLSNIHIDYKKNDNENKNEIKKENLNEEENFGDEFDLPKGDEVKSLNSITSGFKNKNNEKIFEPAKNEEAQENYRKEENNNDNNNDSFDLIDLI